MPASPSAPRPPALRDIPYMGVIYVVAEAMKLGFSNGHPDWCNLGQGQPEVGEMAGAPPRISSVEIEPGDHAYGPIEGTPELREAVAAYYNRLFRQGKSSQYGPENVAVAQGGRLALSRALAAVAPVTLGYQLPDYTAYEDMLELHLARITPIPLRTSESTGFMLTPELFERTVVDQGLTALLVSNPCNPTGRVLAGDDLAKVIETGRRHGVTMFMDEFYSHFIYDEAPGGGAATAGAGPVSCAPLIEDVNEDRVFIFDGLTKNFRYPGWRIGWIVGPEDMINTIGRMGSSMDGGPSRIAQRAALAALEPGVADQETTALRDAFVAKRNLMVQRLSALGVRFAAEPVSTFYAWGNLADLPAPLNEAKTFFRRALERKVMTVPGEYFDVNPGRRRTAPSPYSQWMRFSFGPPMDNLVLGLDRLEALVNEAR